MFTDIDFNSDGEVNYSEFLAATIDKRKCITDENLRFAFHHFDVDGSGFITAHDLNEMYKRKG